jgi:hypothetical protein
LGGFDELFAPFCLEEGDLGYLAWKRGWKVVYQPRGRRVERDLWRFAGTREPRGPVARRVRDRAHELAVVGDWIFPRSFSSLPPEPERLRFQFFG